jgi:nicotinate-nucleotide adenylyltransferase
VTLEHPATIGVVGGTFNPPHLAHLALARYAQEALGLERVALMPAYASPFKAAAPDPGPEHRLRMCALLVKETPAISACALEINRGGVSYTVDTLSAIHASHPDAELTFIVGADTASTLPSWREPARLLELATLAVAVRNGAGRGEVLHSLEALRVDPERVRALDMPQLDVSSSRARERVAAGDPVEELLGREVAAYIAEQGLYRGGAR